MGQGGGLIVSVSGIRGIVGESLDPETVCAFAAALGTAALPGPVALARDGRPSGEMLRHAVLAGLTAASRDVHDLGVLPTPTCGLAVRRLAAAGAVMITASHNPAPYNGLKLFGPDGRVLPAADGQKIQAIFQSRRFHRAPWDEIGRVWPCPQAADWHRDRVLELVDVSAIRARGFTAMLDANGGAGGPLGQSLLDSLGCRIVPLGCNADGRFAHEPEPVAAHLADVGPRVAGERADVGFVLDPDADRLALFDASGRFLGEELTLALAVHFRLGQLAGQPSGQPAGPVVVNMSTSRVVEDVAARHGVACVRAAVGEANVADRMILAGSPIGGEGNGGVIDPRVGYVRDPFIGMALILNLMAATGRSLADLADALPAYHIVKDKCRLAPERLPAAYAALRARWPEARADEQDGLRLDWADRWVHVRPSNTEPTVRVIAEAPQPDAAAQMCREALSALPTA